MSLIVLTEMIVRTCTQILRTIFRDTMKKSKIAQREEPFRDALLHFMNVLLSPAFELALYEGEVVTLDQIEVLATPPLPSRSELSSAPFWTNTFKMLLKKKFKVGISTKECSPSYDIRVCFLYPPPLFLPLLLFIIIK